MAKSRDVEEREMPVEGLDVALDRQNADRINRLVNSYEESILRHLNNDYARNTSKGNRIADRVASFGGSWMFIGSFSVLLVLWILWNVIPKTPHFDAPPYIFLNLILSFLAGFQAPFIMMSQNRQAARDKNESIIDFAINYKAEQEIDDMQTHLHRMEEKLDRVEGQMLLLQSTLEELLKGSRDKQ